MFCSECGKEINNDVKFCPFCGAKQNLTNNDQSESNLKNDSKNLIYDGFKRIKEYEIQEFKDLKKDEIKKIILNEINLTSAEEAEKSYFLKNIILPRFINNEYEGKEGKLYEDLIFKNFSKEMKKLIKKKLTGKDKDPSTMEKVFGFLFGIWIINTFFANFIYVGFGKEGWYIPGISDITPVIVMEKFRFSDKTEFRLGTQEEIWRLNRTQRRIKEGIDYFLK